MIRYKHYRIYYSKKESIKYLLFDNIPLLLGIIYLVLMDEYYFKDKHEVNFLFAISLVPFIIPTAFGNMRLSSKSKN